MPNVANKLRVGVVGTGYLGGFHAEKYAGLGDVDLVGVFDADPARCADVAAACGCRAFATMAQLFDAVDAVSVAVPTQHHEAVAGAALERKLHVLVEKPLAAGAEEGRRLVATAERAGVTLQVGHLERFNPVFDEVRQVLGRPRFIECHRLSPFAGRGTDTNVVYDVMIHDLDLIAFIVGRPLLTAEAVGVSVLSSHVDIANARLRFEGGCIANVTASRISFKRERKLRVFQNDAYVSVNFDDRELLVARQAPDSGSGSGPGPGNGNGPIDPQNPMAGIEVETRSLGEADPLLEEIRDFVACVREGRAPRVSGADGLVALEMAEKVLAALESLESSEED